MVYMPSLNPKRSEQSAKEAYWIKGFMNELSAIDPNIAHDTVPLYIDNMSALKLTKNPEAHARTRHIDIRHHFVRELVEDKIIEPIWIPGTENIADLLTKPLPYSTFSKIVTTLGMESKGTELTLSDTQDTSLAGAKLEGESALRHPESGGVWNKGLSVSEQTET